ncbi:MAG TPA: hypothetical protein VHP11_01795 [Tepidisphaeraceae bacterium]|nr:hypothetical protein [Tepidisphaeraceae bacterium]
MANGNLDSAKHWRHYSGGCVRIGQKSSSKAGILFGISWRQNWTATWILSCVSVIGTLLTAYDQMHTAPVGGVIISYPQQISSRPAMPARTVLEYKVLNPGPRILEDVTLSIRTTNTYQAEDKTGNIPPCCKDLLITPSHNITISYPEWGPAGTLITLSPKSGGILNAGQYFTARIEAIGETDWNPVEVFVSHKGNPTGTPIRGPMPDVSWRLLMCRLEWKLLAFGSGCVVVIILPLMMLIWIRRYAGRLHNDLRRREVGLNRRELLLNQRQAQLKAEADNDYLKANKPDSGDSIQDTLREAVKVLPEPDGFVSPSDGQPSLKPMAGTEQLSAKDGASSVSGNGNSNKKRAQKNGKRSKNRD